LKGHDIVATRMVGGIRLLARKRGEAPATVTVQVVGERGECLETLVDMRELTSAVNDLGVMVEFGTRCGAV